MSTFIDRLKIWASAGTKTKPADAKIATGWIAGEQPPHEWENERMSTRDTALVAVVDAVNDTPAGGRSLFKDRNIAPGIPENAGLMFSADNRYAVDPAEVIEATMNDACLYEYEGVKMLVFLYVPDSGTSYIKAYNIADGTVVNHAFPGDIVVSLCSTGQYIYVLYADLVTGNYEYSLTAIDGLTGTTKPGWSVTDPQVGAEPQADIDGRPFCRVTPGGDILCGGRWDGAAGADKLALIDAAAGTLTRSGDGGLAANTFPSGDCVAVGDVMYFTGLDKSTTDMWLSAVDETDLTVKGVASGSIPANYGAPTTAGEYMSLATLGDHFVIGHKTGVNGKIELYSEAYASPFFDVDIDTSSSKLGPMVFDGVHLWGLFKGVTAGGSGMVLRKISPNRFNGSLDNSGIAFDVDVDSNNMLEDGDTNDTLGYMRPPLIFDGSGIWVSPYAPPGENYTGIWLRLANVYNR
jgi:hypothetical protein